MQNKARIAVILPAYNEELTILKSIKSFHKELPNASIVVVDNNSSDDTYSIVNLLNADYVTLLRENKQGKANAVRKAFKEVSADIYVMCDADMTYPANEVHKLLEPVFKGEADMVVGDRHSSGAYKKENKRNLHNFGNHLVNRLINKLFHADLKDIMSGYRAFSKDFVKNYPIMVEGFELETELSLHALDKRFSIKEIEIDYIDRPVGSFSKLNTYKDGIKIILMVFKIFRYFKPFQFFSFLSLVFFSISFITAVPVFADWINFKYIYHVPLAILATGLSIFALILFSIGIILDAIAYHHRVNFELDFSRE